MTQIEYDEIKNLKLPPEKIYIKLSKYLYDHFDYTTNIIDKIKTT
jgi:hypothetical protein